MAQLLVSRAFSSQRLWHKATGSSSIGGGRYIRYQLACGFNPAGAPLPKGQGYLANSEPIVTSAQVVDVLGEPVATQHRALEPFDYQGVHSLPDDTDSPTDGVRVCSACFPRSPTSRQSRGS